MFIGDKGLMTEKNRWILKNAGFDFVLSHKLRQNNDAKRVINRVAKDLKAGIKKEKKRRKKKGESFREVIEEVVIDDRRFIVCHNEEVVSLDFRKQGFSVGTCRRAPVGDTAAL